MILRRPSTAMRCALFLIVATTSLVGIVGSSRVAAHTGFESSTPAEGDVVDQPVESVTITFTGAPTELPDGFVAFTPQGELQSPTEVATPDDGVFVLTFDPALAGGDAGIRWKVQSADGHVLEDAFAFTVTAPAPTTLLPTTVPATTAPSVTDVPTTEPSTTEPSSIEPVDTEPTPTTADPATTIAEAPAPAESDPLVEESDDAALVANGDGEAGGASTAPTLEEFLATDGSPEGETTATIGRAVSLPAALVAIGVLAFLLTTLRGPRREISTGLTVVRILGVVLIIGAAIEYVGVGRLGSESLGSVWSTEPGLATVLRMIGGLLLAVGVSTTVRRMPRPLSAAVVPDVGGADPDTVVDQHRSTDEPVRWSPDGRAVVLALGVAAIVASFWFDGHTVTEGPRVVHALVGSVHVLAGAVWVGGVVSLATVVWLRHRRRADVRAGDLVIRFSGPATVALASVAAAGAVMAVFVLDSLDDLTGTEWGQTLLLKTAAVAVAAAAGAYNHFRLRPMLSAEPRSPELATRLRSVITFEAILLVFVAVVTAFLVGASTV